MVSIKDYARDCGVSYEAVRKQIRRYAAELDGHIHQQGRTQYLDDVAVAFLSDHRAPAPVAVYTEDTMAKKIEDLQQRVNDLNEELKEAYKEIALQNAAQARLEAAEATQRLLTESADLAKTEAVRNAQRADQAIREAEELRSRLEASEAREKALRDRQQEFEALPFWKKPFWKG